MVIRGAPAIGVAAAMGVALGMRGHQRRARPARFAQVAKGLCATRPTAVNLAWAVERMGRVVEAEPGARRGASFPPPARRSARDLRGRPRRQSRPGPLRRRRCSRDPATVLTHCNAGALATAGYGTALGVVRAAREAGKKIAVFADETRPFLAGRAPDRLGAAQGPHPGDGDRRQYGGERAARRARSCVIVGTDRTAANGDVANKIGTYPLAVMARRHGVPFYVAAPLSSIDLDCPSGAEIPIEQRSASEITRSRRQADHAQRGQSLQSRLRRDAGRVGNRDHHRTRHRLPAIYGKPGRAQARGLTPATARPQQANEFQPRRPIAPRESVAEQVEPQYRKRRSRPPAR